MSKEIKRGTICMIVGTNTPNNGALVEAISPAVTHGHFREEHNGLAGWRCRTLQSVIGQEVLRFGGRIVHIEDKKTLPGTEDIIPTCYLKPLHDGDQEDETLSWKEVPVIDSRELVVVR